MNMSAVLSSAAVFAALTGQAATNYLLETYHNKDVAWTNAACWATSEGAAGATGAPLDADTDYAVVGYALATLGDTAATRDAWSFGGRSLTLGVVGGATGGMYPYWNGSVPLVFGEEGLVLNKGSIIIQWTGESGLGIAGKVTVNSTDGSPFNINSYYANTPFRLEGTLIGAAGTMLASRPNTKNASPMTVTVTADCSGFEGIYRLGSDNTDYKTHLKWGAGPMPGGVYLLASADMECLHLTNSVTVGTLKIQSGATLKIDGIWRRTDEGKVVGTNGHYIVTDLFEKEGDGKVNVVFGPGTVTPNGEVCRVPLLTVPSASSVSTSDFEMVTDDSAECVQVGAFEITEDAVAGTKTLYAVFEPVVVMTSGVGVSIGYGNAMSALTNASSWSDGKLPHSNAHYLVTAIPGFTTNQFGFCTSLRTRCGTVNGHIWSYDYDDVFPGKSLTIGGRAMLTLLCRNFTVQRLRLLEGSGVQKGQWIPPPALHGNVEVSGTVRFGVMDFARIDVAAKVTGTGQIRLAGPLSAWGEVAGGCRFLDLSEFKGTIFCKEFDNAETGTGHHWPDDVDRYQVLYVGAPEQFGGYLDKLNYQALTLRMYSRLYVDASVTIPAECNRGIYVYRELGGTIEVAQSDDGVPYVFDLQVPLTIHGSIGKNGPGTLKLSAPTKFGSTSIDTPIADKNLIHVREGALAAGTTGCVDGVSMTFTNGTSLVLKVDPSDAAYSEYGLVNVKTDSPFTLKGDLTTLPLGFDVVTPAQDVKRFTGALMTVSSAAANSVRAMLPVARSPICGFKVSPVEIERPEMDAVTFAMRYVRVGTIVSVR